jgi:hypothetical protein
MQPVKPYIIRLSVLIPEGRCKCPTDKSHVSSYVSQTCNPSPEYILIRLRNENCSVTGTSQIGDLYTPNCDVGFSTAGCGVGATTPHSYGSSFNSIGGGVYATSWTSEYIKIWFFPRNAIPADITSGNPNPSGWGLPQANMAGDCDIDAHFGYMQLIFDTTFCGDWAGSVWSTDKVCRRLAPTCNSYVAKNPGVFSEA